MTPKIYVVKVNSPIDENTFQFLLKFVQQDKKEPILKQRKKQNADNMLIADVLTKIAINNVFEIPLQEQNFAYSNHGKPYLSGFSDVHFNISHSGTYVACGLADKPIGIDVRLPVNVRLITLIIHSNQHLPRRGRDIKRHGHLGLCGGGRQQEGHHKEGLFRVHKSVSFC